MIPLEKGITMKLSQLGNPQVVEKLQAEQQEQGYELGRIVAEHKGRYKVQTTNGERDAEIKGSLRYHTHIRTEYPAVGDWVFLSMSEDGVTLIQGVLPRKSALRRLAIGNEGEEQIIAANIDYALLMLAADRDFNMNRMERYLTLCHSSRIAPVVLLTKTDLISESEREGLLSQIALRAQGIQTFAISNTELTGYESLQSLFDAHKTYCLLGSSGVGKSTLLNNLIGQERMKTKTISVNNQKGRHTTTHRQLFLLDNGAILIDNPGMREVGMVDVSPGIETTFGSIVDLAKECRFKDCSHVHEKGCAVLKAVADGSLDSEVYANHQKLQRESEFFGQTVAERRRKEKIFSKMQKNFNR